MLLQELRRLATDPEIATTLAIEGYAYRRVRQLIMLDLEGHLVGCLDLAEDTRGPGARGREMEVPDLLRTSATMPILLADGPDYVFGVDPDATRAERAARRHDAFLELTRDCARATRAPAVWAVLRYLENESPPPDLEPGAERVTFRVGDAVVVDLPEVRQYWAQRLRPNSGTRLECLVCGQQAPAADPWPVTIKGIPGGQTSGNQLVSANAPAFESYGLAGSQTSPACVDCAAAVGKALNWLLQHPAHHLRTASSVFAFWARGRLDMDFATLISAPRPDQVRALLSAPRTGRRADLALEGAGGNFYLAEFSASGARIVLRTWIETAAATARENLAAYFAAQAVVMPDGSDPVPLSAMSLALASARDRDALHPDAMHYIITTALSGSGIPDRLLHQAVGRCRVGDRRGGSRVMVTHARAALLKLALCQPNLSRKDKETYMQQLDAEQPSPAYQCGRLLAEMEAVQRAALGNPNATLTDRFYGAASAAPATVYGTLLRNMRNHLAKLRKEKPRVYGALETRVTDIMSKLDELPTTLSLREQAHFALGYYHQRARDRADAQAAKQARDAQAAELASALEGDDTPESTAIGGHA